MQKLILTLLLLMPVFFLPGCGDQLYLEQADIVIVVGVDLDEDNQLTFYSLSPVFREEAEKKYNISVVKASTIRQARGKWNAMSTGSVVGGKAQVFLLGKRLLKQKNIFPYLDVFFRDAKNEINARLIAVDGSVKEIMDVDTEVGSVISEQVDSAHQSSTTVLTRLFEYHRQMFDNRITPSMTEMKATENELIVSGTALLDKKGIYETSLNLHESALLLLLQQKMENPIPLTHHLPPEAVKATEEFSYVNLNIQKVKYKINTNVKNNQFVFDIQMDMDIILTERLFPFDNETMSKQLEQLLAQQIKKDCDALVKKLQQHRIDPIGMGIYARAYQYEEWKKVENDWGKAFSKAKINITPKVDIRNFGVTL